MGREGWALNRLGLFSKEKNEREFEKNEREPCFNVQNRNKT